MIFKKEIHVLGCRQQDLQLKHPSKLERLFNIRYLYTVTWYSRNGTSENQKIKVK